MNFTESKKHNIDFINENMMGPNSMVLIEELTHRLDFKPGMRVLDLGCGKGLTSIFLAKVYGATVYAVDLWVSATENYNRFKELGLQNQIIPLHCDATVLPFADGFFDAIISVDSYHYFGRDKSFMAEKILPLVKDNAIVALSFPGLKQEFNGDIPAEFLRFYTAEDVDTWHSVTWWETLLSETSNAAINISEMSCFEKAWSDWLACDNEYAKGDAVAKEAGVLDYMNFVSIIARKNNL